jgi:hypothetical protein
MDRNKRPYLIYKIDSIRDLFYKNTSNRIVLRNIMHELKFRGTDKAKTLTKDVRGHINRTFGANVLKDIEAELRSVKTKKPTLKNNRATKATLKNNRATNKVESISSVRPDFSALDPVKKDVLKNTEFYSFVKNYPVPIRVKNMILPNMGLIVFNTVYDFVSADLDVQESLLEIPKFGRKSLNDLKQSINGFLSEGRDLQDLYIYISDELNSSSDYIVNEDRFFVDYKLYGKNAAHLSKGKIEALKNISLAFFVNSLDAITTRTRNAILKAEESDTPIYKNLYDFYIAPLSHRRRLLSIDFFGIGSLNNLSNCVDIFVENEKKLISMSSAHSKSKDFSSFPSIENFMNYAISIIENDMHQMIIKERHLKRNPLTLDKLGRQLGVTRERVRQIEAKGCKNIRGLLLSYSPDDIVSNFKEEITNYFFYNSLFISQEAGKKMVKEGSKLIELYIKASSQSLECFLTEWFFYSKKFQGWFVNEDTMHENEKKILCVSTLDLDLAIRQAEWPITLENLSNLMCLPECVVADTIELSKKFYLEKLQNGIFVRLKKKISAKNAVRYVLRRYKKGMSLEEVKCNCLEMFGLELTVGAIGNALGDLPDGLIVDTGTYALYENLNINDQQINAIRNFCKTYLLKEQKYISAFVIFNSLKNHSHIYEKYGPLENGHILFGVCQDDNNFITRKGFMLGLDSDNFKGVHISLTREVVELMKREGRPLGIKEIIKKLSNTRCLIWSSLFGMLDNDKNNIFEKIDGNFYLADDQSHLEINDEELLEHEFDDI